MVTDVPALLLATFVCMLLLTVELWQAKLYLRTCSYLIDASAVSGCTHQRILTASLVSSTACVDTNTYMMLCTAIDSQASIGSQSKAKALQVRLCTIITQNCRHMTAIMMVWSES